MVIPVVMGYDKYSFVSGGEVGQQMHVEEILEVRVLVSRPLVKYVNGTVFQKSCKQRQSLALSLRQICCRELAFLDLHLVGQFKPLEIFCRPLVQPVINKAKHLLEQIEIGKDHGKMATVGLSVVRPDWFVVEIDGAVFRRVESGQQLYKCCFAASITTDDEYHFTGFKRQIEWPEDKVACFTVALISVSNGAELQLCPCVGLGVPL